MPRQPQTKTQFYASAFYAHCVENSKETVIEGEKVNVWEGFIGRTCRELDIPKGMEQRVVRPLEEIGCIQLLQRGVGSYPTVLILRYPPTEDLWVESDTALPLTRRPSFDRLLSRLDNIEKSIGGGNVAEILVDIDRRLKLVESKLAKR